MSKKQDVEKPGETDREAPAKEVAHEASAANGERRKTEKPTVEKKTTVPRRPRAQSQAKRAHVQPQVVAKVRGPAVEREAGTPQLDTILNEIRSMRKTLERLVAPPTGGNGRDVDPDIEGSVDSLRRVLSELIERRTESLVQDLVGIRREAAGDGERRRIVERLDELLKSLGAVRFDGEPMDVVDPLIHVVADERRDSAVPDGVILAALQPGFRTARGVVVCRAAVAVNRRA